MNIIVYFIGYLIVYFIGYLIAYFIGYIVGWFTTRKEIAKIRKKKETLEEFIKFVEGKGNERRLAVDPSKKQKGGLQMRKEAMDFDEE